MNINQICQQIPDYSNRILIVGGSAAGKALLIKTYGNSLLNLRSHQPDTDKIYLYAKNVCEPKYELLINKRENTGLKHLNDSKAFTEYPNDMDDENIEEFNPNKKRKILMVFDDTIADMPSNKKPNLIVTDLLFRDMNIPLVFIKQSYFSVPGKVRLISTHYFITNIPNKWEFYQVASNHSSNIDFLLNIFIKRYWKTVLFFSDWYYLCIR